jgi:type IV secretion system protein VirB9
MRPVFVIGLVLLFGTNGASAAPPDPRLRELNYDAGAVVTVPVKRGVVTHVVLDDDEAITDVGSGLGADCAMPDSSWCIAAQAGGRHIFVKPKSSARGPNNMAVVTDRRTHAFRFIVLPDGDPRPAVFRLAVRAPVRASVASSGQPTLPPMLLAPLPALPRVAPADLVAERLQAKAQILNSAYSIAEGRGSDDIVPTLVFDDGRFTYLRFPGNREVPAVFHVLGDGSESLVNTRMEDDLLVVDRVSRRLVLRAGSAVVGVWNEAFDIDGVPPRGATTVPGVERRLRGEASASHGAAAAPLAGQQRERPHE